MKNFSVEQKTKQQLIMELAQLQIEQQKAISLYSPRSVFVGLESKIQKVYGALMKQGMNTKDIKEEVEEMIRNSW